MTAVLNFRGSEKDLARAQKYIDTGDDEILQNCTQEQLWLIGKMYGVRLKSNRASSKRKEIKAIMQIDRVSMFCKTRDEKILDMCTRRQIRMLEDHFGLKGRHDKVEDGREALRTWLREQKAEEEKEAKRQCEQEETQCQQGGAEALPQNEVPDRLDEISEETDDAPSDEGINVNSSSSRESSLERREVEPKLEPGDNEVQLQREERQARLEQEKAKAEQERAKAEQEKAKAEQEKAKAEQEKLKVGQERAKAEQETAKAELAMIKMEAAKAEQERIKMARRENRAFLNREDCLARLKYLSKPELVLVSAYLEIKIRASDSRVEILSKVHRHLKAEEKQESEALGTKENEEVASAEKEDKGSDIGSDAEDHWRPDDDDAGGGRSTSPRDSNQPPRGDDPAGGRPAETATDKTELAHAVVSEVDLTHQERLMLRKGLSFLAEHQHDEHGETAINDSLNDLEAKVNVSW
ncbi:caldesmon-like [Procambarus clarkii]|uniref:caldesmon-like n=1 Tax=Procambarus clarkii TaxID=6728 RepID=UPI003742F261